MGEAERSTFEAGREGSDRAEGIWEDGMGRKKVKEVGC